MVGTKDLVALTVRIWFLAGFFLPFGNEDFRNE